MTDWKTIQTDSFNEEAGLKELGTLFHLDCDMEEDWADLEDVQSSNAALHIARLADSDLWEVDIDFGSTYNEGAVDDESEQMVAAFEEEGVLLQQKRSAG